MKAFRSSILVCVGFAAVTSLSFPTMLAHASAGLPPAVKQQVDTAVGQWSASGNVAQAGAAIADLCNQNPGVALDIVAYAGETAARAQLPERCLMSSATCEALEQLLALLFERAMQLSGSRVVAALPADAPAAAPETPSVSAPVPTPPPASQENAAPGGGAVSPPAERSDNPDGHTGSGGGSPGGGGRPGGESGGVVPCQATDTCGGEPPPASHTSL